MARRRKKRTSYRRRSRSMSGFGGGTMGNMVGIVAGAVVGKVVATKFSNMNPKIMAAVQIGAGVMLPRFMKNNFVRNMGTGLIVNGAVTGLQSFGVISAINGFVGADNVSYDYEMSGTDELTAIAGYEDEGIMTGTDELQSIAAIDLEDEMGY